MIILKKEKASAELYCTNTDQQNEEENKDYTVSKQIFYELKKKQTKCSNWNPHNKLFKHTKSN